MKSEKIRSQRVKLTYSIVLSLYKLFNQSNMKSEEQKGSFPLRSHWNLASNPNTLNTPQRQI